MSMGLGKTYFVHLMIHHTGDIDSCIEFIKEHKDLLDGNHWIELRPLVLFEAKKKIKVFCYQCDIVEDGNNFKK